MKRITLLITFSFALCFGFSLNAQHKLGLSYNPFVEKYYYRSIIKPVSVSLNYESKEFGRFSIRANVFSNYFQDSPDLSYSLWPGVYNPPFEYPITMPIANEYGPLEKYKIFNIGFGINAKFRLNSANSANRFYVFGGFDFNVLTSSKWYYYDGYIKEIPLQFDEAIYLKSGAGYSYNFSKLIIVYAEPFVNYRNSVGIWQFGVNTGIIFNLGK
jgi:hypothetical protein